jgi:hypothetical protein
VAARLLGPPRRSRPRWRFSGDWSGFAVVATPEQAIAYSQVRQEAGIQYFVVELMVASDTETIHLLASVVMPSLATECRPADLTGPRRISYPRLCTPTAN